MINPQVIITEINKKSLPYFQESSFVLNKNGHKYISAGSYTTCAHNSRNEIKVIKWFLDFWVYVEIDFKKDLEEGLYHIFFSMSVFKGRDDDCLKKQLFRAEWDSFDDNKEHPQPHWHFSTDYNQMYSSFDEMLLDNPKGGFKEMLHEKDNNKIHKFHFAMNALWHDDEGHIHKIDDNKKFIQWFIGLLGHTEAQLRYISN